MFVLCVCDAARAQDVADADTLPAHVGGVIIKPTTLLGSGGMRFGPGWGFGRESFLTDFDNINLAKVLAGNDADLVTRLFGDLGTTRFRASQIGVGINFIAAYGITDRLTVAAYIPFQYSKYQFDAWLVPSNNPGSGGQLAPYGVMQPQDIKCPGGQFRIDNPRDLEKILQERPSPRFNFGDVKNALVSDCLNYLDPVDRTVLKDDGYIHGVADRTYSGFRDLIFGAKYQFYHGRRIQLAGIGYVIAPTGRVEDPRDLFQIRFGDGTWNAALLAAVTIPLGRFRVFGSAGYEYVFSDTHERRLRSLSFSDTLETDLARGKVSEKELFDRRVDDASIIPIVTKYDQAIVSRKLGDNLYMYTGAGYEILEWLSVGVRFDFWHHFRDQITSIGTRFDNTPRYRTEAEIRAEVDALVRNGMVPEDSDPCFEPSSILNCRTKEASARLRDSEGRRKAAYSWHTVRGQVIGSVSVGINTLGPFLRDEFPLPILAAVYASRFIAGQNIDITDTVGLSLTIPIPFGDIKDPAVYGFDGEPNGGLPWP